MDFKGKVALITGGGNGIGRATAVGFARDGARVVAVDRDTAGGEGTVGIIRQQGGEALFVAADVTKSADVQAYVKAALDAYGTIDCFHNNAGIEGNVAPTAEYDEAMFDTVMSVNVKGVFLGLRHVLPVMLKQKRGAIVNTASVAGLVASPGMPAYVASKRGCSWVPASSWAASASATSPTFRSAVTARRTRWRMSCCSYAPIWRATSPARSTWSMAGARRRAAR